MQNYLIKKKFKDVDLKDSFFDSLKSDYTGFETWFHKKGEEEAFLKYDNDKVQGFLYLKYEKGPIKDIEPNLCYNDILKIGTFKINPHGTRLGERFIKKALDYAISMNVEICYVTIFKKHNVLLELFERYGFIRHGEKNSSSGTELVLVKHLKRFKNEILLDYPLIDIKNSNKFLLAIYPKYHSRMFPDSILNNESVDILEDVSHTNSIHKIYVCSMDIKEVKSGDIFVIYRTKTQGLSAEYTSVVTSICVVEEVKRQEEFLNFSDFFKYANSYSIFNRGDLRYWYNKGGCYIIKMTYNAALSKRLIRKKLIEDIGLERNKYWGFFKLSDGQFEKILKEGGVCESIIIN